jgi:HlyD family secretion protein
VKLRHGLALALTATVLIACQNQDATPSASFENFNIVTAEIGDIRDIIPAVGPLRAATEVEVGAEVSGRILDVQADFNDPVEQGQLLARIDPAPFESALAQAQAQLTIAQAAVVDAEAELAAAREERTRLARLVERNAGREADLTDLNFRIQSLQSRLQSAEGGAQLARGRLQQAEIDLARTEIRSPVDGFVLDRRIEQGQAVNAVQSAPTLFVVTSDLDRMFIEAAVSEADIGRIETDMDVRFGVDAFPSRYFSGEIDEIRRAPVREGRFVSYHVIVSAENRVGLLLPGMTASVEFVRADAREVLRLPLEALYFTPADYEPVVPQDMLERFTATRGPLPEDPDIRRAMLYGMEGGNLFRQGKRRIFVLGEDGDLERREIRLGGEDQTHVEVIEGLELGEQVVIDEAD